MSRAVFPLVLTAIFLFVGILLWNGFSGSQKTGETVETKLSASDLGPLRAINPPKMLPDFRFVDGSGVERTLADFRGKTLLVNIWATWCPPCREEMPSLDRLQSTISSENFYVLTISTDLNGISVVQDFFAKVGISSLEPYIDYEGEAESNLKVPGLPTTLLVDKQGNAIGVKVGPMQWDSPEVVTVIKAQLSPQVKLEKR